MDDENNIIWHVNALNMLPPMLMGGNLRNLSQ